MTAYESVIRILDISGILNYEIIISTNVRTDGSHDGTPDVADQIAAKFRNTRSLRYDHYVGLGYKYRKAAKTATKDYLMMIPGDGEFEENSIIKILEHIGRKQMIVTYHANPKVRNFKRRFVAKGFTVLCNLLFGLNLPYYNGLNILPRRYLLKVPMKCNNFAYMAEILIYLVKSDVDYVEVPWSVKPSINSSAFNLRSIFEALGTLLSLFWRINILRERVSLAGSNFLEKSA